MKTDINLLGLFVSLVAIINAFAIMYSKNLEEKMKSEDMVKVLKSIRVFFACTNMIIVLYAIFTYL